MGVMPLVPETKMADARKHSVSGNPLARRTTWSVLKTASSFKFRPAFLEPTPGHVFSINTSSSNTLSLFHISLTGPTHSLQCDFQREYYHSLISTNSRQLLQKMYMSRNHSLNSYTFSVKFFQLQKQLKFRRTTERNKQ